MAEQSPKPIDFEQQLKAIEQLVNKMEQGNLPLAESLRAFEDGIKRVRDCRQALDNAEQTVRILTESHQLEPFGHDDNSPEN